MIKAHRIRLNLTLAQAAYLRKAAGTARFVFNWSLRSTPAFYLASDKLRVDGHWIQIPKLGHMNMTEQLRFAGKIMSAVVSYRAGWWWISIWEGDDRTWLRSPRN